MPFIDNWHIGAICDHLEAVKRGEIRDLVINIPPGHAKSIVLSVMFPAWMWLIRPEWRALCSSYDQSLVIRDAVRTRDVIDSAWYQQTFEPDWTFTKDQNTKTFYRNTRRGFRFCHTVAGKGTGHRGDAILVDDPLNAKDRHSKVKRASVLDWWDRTMPTRLNDPRTGVRIIVMQRLHEEDLTGHVERAGGWQILSLPTEFDMKRRSVTYHVLDGNKCEFWRDPREKEGELLFPKLFTPEVLGSLRKQLGEADYSAQHLQRPYPAGGMIFKEEWFQNRYRSIPVLLEVWSVWDTALKDGQENDESACIVVGKGEDGNVYVLRVLHGRWETPKLAEFLIAQAKWLHDMHGDRYRGDFVEDKVSGTTLMQYVRRSHPDIVLIGIKTGTEGKEERAHGITPLCESGRVLLPDGSSFPASQQWVADLIAQLIGFPKVKHDDLVDVLVYALKRFLGALRTSRARRGKSSMGDH